ncbi:MAG: hypothetical protein CMJ76_10455 [Planctomycetaceae bacterium]|nr:hypothetical protein [Planctomycetaceae bacterium]
MQRLVFLAVLFFAGLLGNTRQLIAAPPTITSYFPAGVQKGTSQSVTLTGSWTKWPVDIDGEFPEGITVKAQADEGVLEFTVAETVASGPYYFRVYDGEGASILVPLVVGSIAEIIEQEPNAKLGEWKTIELPATLNGQLKESGDVDIVGVNLAAGESISVMVIANNLLGSPMDGILQVADERGFVVAQNDDERNIDPQLSYTASREGTYQIRLFAFPTTPNSTIGFSAAATYVYRMTLTKQKFLDYCLPLSLNSNTAAIQPVGLGFNGESLEVGVAANGYLSLPGVPGSVAIPIFAGKVLAVPKPAKDAPILQATVPVSLSGVLNERAEKHVVQLNELKKDTALSVKAYARRLGFPTDPYLQIADANGVVLHTLDDKSRDERDPEFIYKVPADGNFQLSIRDLHRQGGTRFAYRVDVEVDSPKIEMSVDRGELLKTKENLLIPLTIVRTAGFDKVMEVSLNGLPEGLSANVVKSEATGNSSKKVQLVLKGNPQAYSGPVTIVGTYEGGGIEAHYTVKNSALIRNRFWLTVLPAADE